LDPEIPVLTVDDLGIVRDISIDDGRVTVTVTPTYSGCPAIDPIKGDVERAVRSCGYAEVEVHTQLAPAWTTDWMTDEGRRKLEEYGIAPPQNTSAGCPVLAHTAACPRCGSCDTRQVSRFGSTPCQAQFVCNSCCEPFDYFKAI
jgi:ring-1,2-phenylacetyl-CoA epoxidase subunit PaaD